MKPLWKVKGFEKQTYQPQQTRKDARTDRRKVTVMHKTSRRTGTGTGTGTARRGTAQDSRGEQNRQGDTETTLTFRAQHGNHIVSIPFETIVKKKNTERRGRLRPQMSRPGMRLSLLDTQHAFLPFSFLISLIPTFFSIFCRTGTPQNNSIPNSGADDQRRITKTSEKLTKSLPGPLVKLSN